MRAVRGEMAKAIREFTGKDLLHKYMEKLKSENSEPGAEKGVSVPFMSAPVDEDTDFELLVKSYPWLEEEVWVCGRDGRVCVYM